MTLFAAEVWWLSHLLNLIVLGLGLMLMLIVLIQRGKGGGLAGAFGGAGGSSPFGSRAGDVSTSTSTGTASMPSSAKVRSRASMGPLWCSVQFSVFSFQSDNHNGTANSSLNTEH